MEKLIKIKTDNGIQLLDSELAVRWWLRLEDTEKQSLLNKYLPNFTIEQMTYGDMFWVWKQKQL